MMEENGNPPPPPLQDSRSIHIMANLKDSLLTHLAKSNPSLSINIDHASSFIQQRLPQLFHSFHTPTHPPYALMIQNALNGLNEENGSTEEAISEFIKREYEDLPWAHVRILGVQLKNLCENGELVCNEGGRYVFVVDDEKGTECKGSKKRKKRKKSNNSGKKGRKGRMEMCESVERDIELQEERINEEIQVSEFHDARTDEPRRMVIECMQEQVEEEENPLIEEVEGQAEAEKGLFEVDGKQSQSECQETGVIEQHGEAEAAAQSEVVKSQNSQIQDSVLHLETICSSQQTALNLLVDSPQPLQGPISEGLPKCVPSAGIELSITQLQQQMPCNVPSESSLGAPAKMSASLPSLDVREHKQDENPMSGDPEQQIPKRQCRGRPRKSEPAADYQGESLLASSDVISAAHKPNINKIEKRVLSQLKEWGIGRGRHHKLHRNAHKLKEQIQPQDQAQCMVVPISEGSPECIISTGTQLSPNELQLKMSSEIDLGTTSKMEASLAYMNVHDVQLQHGNQESPKEILDENQMSGDPEQKPPKRPRGRPHKLKTDTDYPSALPSSPKLNQNANQHREMPPKINRNANQSEEQLQQEDQARQHGQGRGRGTGRRRGRPRKVDQNANQCEENLPLQDQAQGLVAEQTGICEPKRKLLITKEQLQEENQVRKLGQGRGRGRGTGRGKGRPPKVDQNANQCEENLPLQDQAQGLVAEQTGICEPKRKLLVKDEQLQEEDQARKLGRGRGRDRGRGRGTGRGRGRPPKVDQNANQCEENLPLQDQAQGLPQLLPPVQQIQWQTCQRISMESALYSLSDANQTLQQLRPQILKGEGHQQDRGWDQNQDLGQERLPNPMLDANQSHQLLQPQVKRRGRPPKPKQD